MIDARSESSTEVQPLPGPSKTRFYRPELDVLRFVAFVLVFLTHGPRLNEASWAGHLYNRLAGVGVYGLSLFFFLSSYLITELLLQEKERSGRVHLKAFYVRRILRIWPLYFAGILLGLALSAWRNDQFGFSKTELLCFVFFLGYLPGSIKSPIGHLWSISVEELFYAIWPVLSRLPKATLFFVSLAIFPISLALASWLAPETWYNPVIQFLFFAAGYMAAICLHRRNWSPIKPVRLTLLVLGVAAWFSISPLYHYLPLRCAEPAGYVFSAIGCVSFFLSVLGVQIGEILAPVIYLGKISYGLYVFHLPWLRVIDLFVLPRVSQNRFPIHLATGFLLTIATAALSYRLLEQPFLRLKSRFEFVRTRSR
jgi:peptidoglycan/LPS O-acetylase OafA/YrhL